MKKTFTIGTSGIPCEFIVPLILPELKERLAGIEIRVMLRYSREIFEKVENGEIEVGIVGTKYASESVRFEPIFKSDRLILIAPPGHPLTKKSGITLNDLEGQDFIGFSSGTGTRDAYDKVFSDAGFSTDRLNVVVEMGDTRGVIQAVEVGTGIAVVSDLVAKNRIKSGKVVVIDIPVLSKMRTFYLITPKNRPLSAEAWQVATVTKEVMGAV